LSDKEHDAGTFSPIVASLEIVDVSGEPIAKLHYKLTLPDGTEKESSTEDDGSINIPAGVDGELTMEILSEGSGEDQSENPADSGS